ncbi:hypothetical protein [Collinsella sp. An7]|uniref:hypothetical protein n=1 Tax=Collinsella sp. An7 TaxID=1965651 RepID=UPI0013029DA7|nr:hypothetical protein [Collinsella sp. An7]
MGIYFIAPPIIMATVVFLPLAIIALASRAVRRSLWLQSQSGLSEKIDEKDAEVQE